MTLQKFRALEWLHLPEAFPAPLWIADTSFGSYTIEETNQSDSPGYEVRYEQALVCFQDSLEAAKSDAQTNLERRGQRLLANTSCPSEATP
jgi:hypothetical protein